MILHSITKQFSNSPEFTQLSTLMKSGSPAPGKKIAVEGIAPGSFPLIIASFFEAFSGQILLVTENSQKMEDLYLDLSCYCDEDSLYRFPPRETLPYEFISPTEKNERMRVTALYKLISKNPAIIIATVDSLLRTVPEKNYFIKKGLTLRVGDEYPFDDIIETLVSYGFTREERVETFGSFAVKGGIIDVYLPSHDLPFRLDFFGDTLESIRDFNVENQVSRSEYKQVILYQRKEVILFPEERQKLVSKITESGRPHPEKLAPLMQGDELHSFDGIEDIFPLIIEETTVLSYLDKNAAIILLETPELEAKRDIIIKSFNELYEQKRGETLCLPPERLLKADALDIAAEKSLILQSFTTTPDSLKWRLRSVPNFRGKIKSVRDEIRERLEQDWKVIITTGFEGQSRRLYDLFAEFKPDDRFEELSDKKIDIIISPMREGVEISPTKTIIISDHEIFGKSYRKKRQFKKKSSRPIDSYLDLSPGDYVVHINHGIGTFKKIERMTAGDVERDFLTIEYADEDRLYVSLDQLTLVQKYIGIEGKKPRVDHLGKKSAWNRIKKKVQDSVEEIAEELIKIYAARREQQGFSYPPDTLWQEEFEALFEYEETPDQITAIEDVKDDMESTRPMERLICGDVGFGKTEVAIRAAFKAVMAGRQVVILVPTTILAMQHHNTFIKRFADYPIEIEMLSRFRTYREAASIKKRLREGEIDIIIGTHALLGNDISIKNPGLLIIDEEQRFGVKHKEKLKKIRTMVDVLTLSATPIPRTLHMAMAGIRDLSIIMTPPENRQSIETYVLEENPDILRAAILNEIKRGGQVFFVHNRVQTINAVAGMLEALVPEAAAVVAHGQMEEHELEEVMIDFLNQKYDVLISTSIIESGLDMPNVNTIIINRADAFGLSQLYQLKGRVGRSTRRAFAYLFYPTSRPLTEEAQKRLSVIAEYSELGSGFKIAMKDLEIRGAGNILGKQQSGYIMEVGFELYMKMLDEAVQNLKGESSISSFRTPVFLKNNFYIPDNYISDEKQKIEFYKRFEACETSEEIDQVEKELIDRFGPSPQEVSVLIELERIRTLASDLMIDEIIQDSKSIRIKITSRSTIKMNKLVAVIQNDKRVTIDRDDNEILLFKPDTHEGEKKLLELKKWLQQFK